MMTMTAVAVQTWTDGISLVCREGRTVTVQILGDVWHSRYETDDDAAIAFAAEIAAACDGPAVQHDGSSIEDDHEWIRRGC